MESILSILFILFGIPAIVYIIGVLTGRTNKKDEY